ncbi:MAG: hypothetical protein GF400_07280 [Candidatus Eisenbacteria bacterium]|nr:hypothetical protein [Candidatus Eisenbacteria bacterium]
MSYETYWEDEGVRWVYEGTMTDDDVLRANLELYDDPRFESLRYEIADFTRVAKFAAGADSIRKLSQLDKKQSARNPDVKVAIVATAPLMRGIARMYALASGDSPWDTRIFETESEAREWLSR